ncbi:hypothetical protein SAMN04489747_2761 [Auraticoccus monumenti]|uniref:F0F1-ATPase subunit Ca2+/Mg2+ transporter n=2 Tax=Auraticoccus monumenti TaxID=675864 RepID=A0A1G7AXW2_9ACTN|nr:hypothetical protein SAMN04489747_2761 [Auraticoccus monumenti]
MTGGVPADSLRRSSEETRKASAAGEREGMRVLSYVLAGPVVYGGLGWVGDHFLGTQFLLPVGAVLGIVLSVYMIVKRYGVAT